MAEPQSSQTITSEQFIRLMENAMNGGKKMKVGGITTDGKPMHVLTREDVDTFIALAGMIEGPQPPFVQRMVNTLRDIKNFKEQSFTKSEKEVYALHLQELKVDFSAAVKVLDDPQHRPQKGAGKEISFADVNVRASEAERAREEKEQKREMKDYTAKLARAEQQLSQKTGMTWQWNTRGGLSSAPLRLSDTEAKSKQAELQKLMDEAKALDTSEAGPLKDVRYRVEVKTTPRGETYFSVGGGFAQPDVETVLKALGMSRFRGALEQEGQILNQSGMGYTGSEVATVPTSQTATDPSKNKGTGVA